MVRNQLRNPVIQIKMKLKTTPVNHLEAKVKMQLKKLVNKKVLSQKRKTVKPLLRVVIPNLKDD